MLQDITASHYVVNRLRQWTSPEVKIFFIGFNKCATTALHHFMRAHGIKSAHWVVEGRFLADEIEERLSDKAELRAFLNRWTAFSDLVSLTEERLVEGNRHFRLFHGLFPDAYFVLNDRNVDAWILSRKNHRKGKFLARCMRAMNADANLTTQIWRDTYVDHVAQVTNYFRGSPRFLHYRIDCDPITSLVDFLFPDFSLSELGWQSVNQTKHRSARKQALSPGI